MKVASESRPGKRDGMPDAETPPDMRILGIEEPLAIEVVGAIRSGDLATLRTRLAEHRWLATARMRGTPVTASAPSVVPW